MKNYLPIILFFLFSVQLIGQKKLEIKQAVYHRSSLSYLFINYNGKYKTTVDRALASIEVPSQLDDNRLKNPVIEPENQSDLGSPQRIEQLMQQKRIPNQIMEIWFDRKSDGTFDMETILKRGQYNANDSEVLTALSMERGMSALDQTAMQLVNSSYILIMKLNNLESYDEMYDQMNRQRKSVAKRNKTQYKPVTRLYNGYMGQIDFQLFQIDFSDSIASIFYRDLWTVSNDDEAKKNDRKRAFDTFNFPLIYHYQTTLDVASQQINSAFPLAPLVQASDQDMMARLFEKGVSKFLDEIEELIPKFKVRANILNTKPVAAKIGLKEGLRVDQRFFVYENRMDKSGRLYADRKGVVRVKNVVDNRSNADGQSESTVFYQLAGHKLGTGMILESHKGANMSFYAGYQFMGEINGGVLRLDYNLSSFFASLSADGNASPGIKVFLEAGFDFQEYKSNGFKYYDKDHVFKATIDDNSDEIYRADFAFTRFGGGFAKQIVLKPNLILAPEVAWNYEWATSNTLYDENDQEVSLSDLEKVSSSGSSDVSSSDNLSYSVHYLKAGAQLIINIAYPFQLYGSIDFYAPILGPLDRNNDHIASYNWNDFFKNRNGMTVGAGMRIEF